jgi:hypothetical protein
MRSSRIKKNSGRYGVNIERTEHNFRFHHRGFFRHMSHLFVVWYLLVTVLLLGGLLIDLLKTVIRQVTFFSTTETLGGSIRSTSFHWSVVRGTLTLILVPILLRRAVIAVLRLIRRTL